MSSFQQSRDSEETCLQHVEVGVFELLCVSRQHHNHWTQEGSGIWMFEREVRQMLWAGKHDSLGMKAVYVTVHVTVLSILVTRSTLNLT